MRRPLLLSLATLLPACGHAPDDGVEPDEQVDVIVVGSGPAGTAAALTARAAGASVLLFERSEEPGSGLLYGGLAFAVGSAAQQEAGVEDSVALAMADWPTITGVSGELPGVADFIANSADNIVWLEGYGAQVPGLTNDLDSGSVSRIHNLDWTESTVGDGRALLAAFDGELRTGVEVTGPLIEGGEVVGVTWKDLASGETGASGARAVVVATGGFLRDLAEVQRVQPALSERELVFETNLSSNGGGLPFLSAVGAGSLSPEQIGVYVHAIADFGAAEGEALVAIGAEHGILVDESGERFANEELQRSLDLFNLLPPTEIFAVLPESMAGELRFMRPYYNWSNPPEPEILEWTEVGTQSEDAFVGASLAELGALAGIDAQGLASTVEAFNTALVSGTADPFGRDLSDAALLEGDSWVALRIRPGLAKNFGGVATDEAAHVLDPTGRPIPGLYAAGEVAGMVLGGGGGSGFSGSVNACYWGGRVAGREAAGG